MRADAFMLRHWQPADAVVDDFQDLFVWRWLVKEQRRVCCASSADRSSSPMTLLNPGHFEEIVGRLRVDGAEVCAATR